MKRLLVALTLVATIARAESPKNPIDLFSGGDLAAWEFVTLPAPSSSNESTKISSVCKFSADGSLAVAGKPVGYIATKISYENYHLHAEWRWPKNAAKNSNGGVLLHIATGPINGVVWPVCFQAQLKLARSGDLLPMNNATFAEKLSTPPDAKTPQLDRTGTDPERPLGEWNSYDITCRGHEIEISVNGRRVNRVTRCVPAVGQVGFQLEGMPFELRNVRLEPAPRAIGGSYQDDGRVKSGNKP